MRSIDLALSISVICACHSLPVETGDAGGVLDATVVDAEIVAVAAFELVSSSRCEPEPCTWRLSVALDSCELAYDDGAHRVATLSSADCEAIVAFFRMPAIATFLYDPSNCIGPFQDTHVVYRTRFVTSSEVVKDATNCRRDEAVAIEERVSALTSYFR